MSLHLRSNVFKPRYTIAHLAKSKVWPYKNSRLRRLVSIRGRRLQRGGLFRRYVLVSTTIKWTERRRHLRPLRRRSGYGRAGGGRIASGRPQRRRYRDAFYRKQQVRAFHGKRSEAQLRRLVLNFRGGATSVKGDRSRTFFAALESRLDRVLFRRRLIPTIYACNQFIRHVGVSINGGLVKTPQAHLRIGDTLSLVPTANRVLISNRGANLSGSNANSVTLLGNSEAEFNRRRQIWRTLYWDIFCRLYYRRWGLYVLRRRLTSQLKIKVRPFIRRSFPSLPIIPSISGSSTRTGRYSRANSRSDLVNVLRRRLNILGGSSTYSASLAIPNSRVSRTYTSENLPVLRHRLKVWRALRLRASFLPRIRRDIRNPRNFATSISVNQSERSSGSSLYLRPFRRITERRFRANRRNKNDRRRKRRRLVPVHIRFPTYLQRDLRTLRATRIHAPTSEEVYYPFRASLAQVRTFYRSRGI